MSDRDHERIRELFRRAREMGPDRRKRFLDEECAGDPELRAEIESLLEWDRTPRSGETAATDEPEIPESIGPYRVLATLGEGGMGIVFLAEQEEPVRRLVALKIIKPGMDSREILARFESERQALALMSHPNVARIYDAGSTERGRPYFVMEYVQGIPVTAHCDEHRVGIRDRLELFRQICDGVHHAHQKGIIHRDLKPSNVLVQYEDGRATPKIIDFGVAKALGTPLTERSFFTARGRLIGTPEYMSPEQARLTAQDVDTRSDIYSLGVLLYELLTGALPFDRDALRRAGIDGMLRLIRDSDPPRPSTRLRTLATSDPARSSETARRRGVDARTLTRRLQDDLDWITMMCLEKDRSRRYASAAELADDIGRHLGQQPVRARPPSAAYRAVKFWRRRRGPIAATALVTLVFLAGLVTATALTVSRVKLRNELDRRLARDLVADARMLGYDYPEEAARRLERAIELDRDFEEAYLEGARLLRRRKRPEEAVEQARAVLAANPGSGSAAALLAGLLRDSDPAESERLAERAERLLETHELWVELALADDDERRAIDLLTRSLEEMPWNFEALWQRAVRHYAIRDYDRALEDAETMIKVREDLALTWILKGAGLLGLERRSEDAEAKGRLRLEAKACFDEAVARDPENWIPYYNRALVHGRMGQHDKALEDLDRAIELRPDEAELHTERGRNLELLDRADEAVDAYARVVELGEDDWGTRWDLGAARWGAGDFAGAAEEFTAALDGLPAGTGHDRNRWRLMLSRAEIRLFLRQLDRARVDLESASALGPDDARLESLWGRLFRLENRYTEALVHLDRAVRLAPEDVTYVLERGVAYWKAGEHDPAVADLMRFAESDEADAPWVRLWVWEIETRRGNEPAAAGHLDAVRAVPDRPLLARVAAALAGEQSPDSVLEAAETDRDRLYAFYALGAGALAAPRPDLETARGWFRRLTALGMINHLEHELAEWRLRQLDR